MSLERERVQEVVNHAYKDCARSGDFAGFYATIQGTLGNCRVISIDHREWSQEASDQVQPILEELGCMVLVDPYSLGSDTYGFLVFSDRFTTPSEPF